MSRDQGWAPPSTQAMRRTLVLPGMSKGMPPVMTRRCLSAAMSSWKAIRAAFWTVSAKVLTSPVWTLWMP
jgi:hypothetical protein